MQDSEELRAWALKLDLGEAQARGGSPPPHPALAMSLSN